MELDNHARKMQKQYSMVQGLMPNVRMVQMMQEQVRIVQKLLPEIRTAQQILLAQTVLPEIRIAQQMLLERKLLPEIRAAQQILQQVNLTGNLLSQTTILQTVADQAKQMQRLLPEISVLQKIIGQTNLANSIAESVLAIKNTNALWGGYASLSRLPWTNIGSALGIDEKLRTILANDFLAFSDSYLTLSASFERANLESHIVTLVPVFALPEVEFFNGADLLDVITIENEGTEDVEVKQSLRDEVSTQTTEKLEILLAELDANLVRLWQGAIQALTSSNVDRSRHFLISLRELFTQVLHQLAPNDKIKSWTTSPEHFANGNPTRRARLLFICRGINLDPFSSFVEKDIASILSACDIFNRAHEVAIPFTQEQLTVLKIRVEGALRLLLITAKMSR